MVLLVLQLLLLLRVLLLVVQAFTDLSMRSRISATVMGGRRLGLVMLRVAFDYDACRRGEPRRSLIQAASPAPQR